MFSSKKNKEKNSEKESMDKEKEEVENQNQIPQQEELQMDEVTQAAYEEKIKNLEKEIETYKDRYLRKAAEFENYKRRAENDQLNLIKYSAESFIMKLLPVVDDFERSLYHIQDAKDVESIKDGIKLVYEKLIKMLADQGVKPIEAVGKPFDVNFHEAVMQKKAVGVPSHTVLEEIEKGYTYKDRVIRHSKVVVSEDSIDEPSTPENASGEDKQSKNES